MSRSKVVAKYTAVLRSEIGEAVCIFCKRATDDELTFGKFYTLGDISCHYFCVLLSCCAVQNGKDNEGLFGFLYTDIVQEAKRGKKYKCSYCGKRGATLGCIVSKCRKQFHLPCGREHNAVSIFHQTFHSYCEKHAPRQAVPAPILARAQERRLQWERTGTPAVRARRKSVSANAVASQDVECGAGAPLESATEADGGCVCVICYCPVEGYPSPHSFWPPCCARDEWFHRQCLQRMALSAGMHYLKCPLCNERDVFYAAVMSQGIYIPDRDAAWELEQNAFASLYERPKECVAEVCKCSRGRNFDGDTGEEWELQPCLVCGSVAAHGACGVRRGWRRYVCPPCTVAVTPPRRARLERDLIQSTLASPAAAPSPHRGRIMPSRMSLRSKDRLPLTTHTSQAVSSSKKKKSVEESRLELNLKTPRLMPRVSVVVQDVSRSPERDACSPMKLLDERWGARVRGMDDALVRSLATLLRDRIKRPLPLSVKRRIVNKITQDLLSPRPTLDAAIEVRSPSNFAKDLEEIPSEKMLTEANIGDAAVEAGAISCLNAEINTTDSGTMKTETITTDSATFEAGMVTTDSAVLESGMVTTDSAVLESGMVTTDSAVSEAGQVTTDSAVLESGMVTTDSALLEAGQVTTDSALLESGMVTTDSAMLKDTTDFAALEAETAISDPVTMATEMLHTDSMKFSAEVVTSPDTAVVESVNSEDKVAAYFLAPKAENGVKATTEAYDAVSAKIAVSKRPKEENEMEITINESSYRKIKGETYVIDSSDTSTELVSESEEYATDKAAELAQMQDSVLVDDSSTSTFELPSEFIADRCSDDSVTCMETPKKSQTAEMGTMYTMAEGDSKMRQFMVKTPVKPSKCVLKFSPLNTGVLSETNLDIDLEDFKDRYLTEVERGRREGLKRKRRKDRIVRVNRTNEQNTPFGVGTGTEEANGDSKRITKKRRMLSDAKESGKIKRRLKNEKLDTERDSTSKERMRKKKFNKREMSIMNSDIKLRIKWKEERINVSIDCQSQANRQNVRRRRNSSSMQQMVLDFSQNNSSHHSVIVKPEEPVELTKRKYKVKKHAQDSLRQTSLMNYFRLKQ